MNEWKHNETVSMNCVSYHISAHLTEIFCPNPDGEKFPVILVVNILHFFFETQD